MVKIKKYANFIERFLHGEKGEWFFNFAYCIGAAIAIWGALFEILHVTGGKTLLCIGLGTEVLMFILSAFDRPHTEKAESCQSDALSRSGDTSSNGSGMCNQIPTVESPRISEGMSLVMKSDLPDIKAISENLNTYADQVESLNRKIVALNAVFEMQLKSVSAQIDSFDSVNKNMKDIRDMYEKSAADSVRYAEEARKMSEYMSQLNSVYEKMISAMSIHNPIS